MLGQLAAFLGISMVVIVTPGPDVTLTIRNVIRGGRGNGMSTALGIVSGLTIWTLATSAGLAALLIASRPAFTALKLAGAAYLILLGARSLWSLITSRHAGRTTPAATAVRARSPLLAFREGIFSNLGNPKIAVFFTSLLPQFANHDNASFWNLLSLGLVFCGLTFACLAAYITLAARAGDLLQRPDVRRMMEAVSGTMLMGLGLKLAAERR